MTTHHTNHDGPGATGSTQGAGSGSAADEVVLFVEDDLGIAGALVQALRSAGYTNTHHCPTVSATTSRLETLTPTIALLDITLPDGSGLDIATQLRAEHPEVVIIMLTANDAERDIIAGLDAGADDYLTKPFKIDVLLARIRAQTRRRSQLRAAGADTPAQPPARILRVGDLRIDLDAHRVMHTTVTDALPAQESEHEIILRPREYDLLVALASRRGKALTAQELMDLAFGHDATVAGSVLQTHMSHLRHALRTVGIDPIKTIHKSGYRLDP